MRLGDCRGLLDRWNLCIELAWTEIQQLNLVLLRLFQKAPLCHYCELFVQNMSPAFLGLPNINFRMCVLQWTCTKKCPIWIVCNRTKHRQTFDHPHDKCTMFQWGILWAKQVENWLDKLFLRARQVVIFATSEPQNHAHKQIRFPSARRDAMGRPKSAFWRGRPGASLRAWWDLTEVGKRIPQLYSAWNPPKLQGASNHIPKNALIPTLKNWPEECPIEPRPPDHKNTYNCKHICSNNMGMSTYSKPTRNFPRKHGDWHSKSRCGIKTPWSHMKVVCKYTHCQTCKHQTYFHDETWNCDCVVSSIWVPTFAYALFGTQWGTDLRHVKKIAKTNEQTPQKGLFRVNACPCPQSRFARHCPGNQI